MRTKVSGIVVILMALSIWLAGPLATRGQGGRRNEQRDFMRQKLDRSQKILEGIILEDYGLIVKNAMALRALSEDARWRVGPNFNHLRLGSEFRVIADELAGKARQRNLDGATLAYLKLTMSCVECHKLVRDVGIVSSRGPVDELLSDRRTQSRAIERQGPAAGGPIVPDPVGLENSLAP